MNTFQSRLDKIEKSNNNCFKHTINKITRKGSEIIDNKPFHFEKFEFNGNWHSNHISEEKFTNFLRSYEGNINFILKDLFQKLYDDNYSIWDDFQLEENCYSEISQETKRLKRIIAEVNNLNRVAIIPEINELIPVKRLKDKKKQYKGIRLFVNIRENRYVDLYLIDLYHLAINAYSSDTGSYNLDRNYNSNKDCNKCISKIADECIKN